MKDDDEESIKEHKDHEYGDDDEKRSRVQKINSNGHATNSNGFGKADIKTSVGINNNGDGNNEEQLESIRRRKKVQPAAKNQRILK